MFLFKIGGTRRNAEGIVVTRYDFQQCILVSCFHLESKEQDESFYRFRRIFYIRSLTCYLKNFLSNVAV